MNLIINHLNQIKTKITKTITQTLIKPQSSFTLVEILIVVAIVAVLGVAVIIVLNPQEMIKKARDSQRLSDLTNLSKTINWYEADTGGKGFMGSSSVVYVSIPDSTSTCANLGLPALPSGWSYRCVPSSTLQNIDGTGWIPINFNQISFGRTLSKLPIDPINTTSSGNYYTYVTGGSYKLTSRFESQKYVLANTANDGGSDPALYEVGTDLSLAPFVGGMVGYWSFDEGSGTTAYDRSGNNNNGTLTNGPTWTTGKVGGALSFDGVDDCVPVNNSQSLVSLDMTITMWLKPIYDSAGYREALRREGNNGYQWSFYGGTLWDIGYKNNSGIWNSPNIPSSIIPALSWTFVGAVYNSKALSQQRFYINGIFYSQNGLSDRNYNNNSLTTIGSYSCGLRPYLGLIDEVRIYNRALSDQEIRAIYEATK